MPKDSLDIGVQEQLFYDDIREYLISFIFFMTLYTASYFTICFFKKRLDNDEYCEGEEDAVVYRISLWMCTFVLAVSFGAVFLLPLSVVSNEILLLYPDAYYVKWLNSSLINSLWNHVFLTSNLSWFILLPFAYFFTESEGFSGSRKGILARLYETVVVLIFLAIVVCGLAWVISLTLHGASSSQHSFLDIWNFYLPYLYSCVSLIGVGLLLVCTPVGFATMFSVIGQLVMKPTFLRDIEDELHAVKLEEQHIKNKIKSSLSHHSSTVPIVSNGHSQLPACDALVSELNDLNEQMINLEKRSKASSFRKNFCYPIVMMSLFILTMATVMMIALNSFELICGNKDLPVNFNKEFVLGVSSMSFFGSYGVALETVLIFYLMVCSVVGFYSLPYIHRWFQPRHNDTPLIKIIGHCGIILTMSSALPVMSKTLGLTNFDLLGKYGQLDWLGNFVLILSYNLIFGVVLTLCIFTKFTSSIRRELRDRFVSLFRRETSTLHSDVYVANDG